MVNGIHSASASGDFLHLENVTVYGASAALAHYYNGSFRVNNSTLSFESAYGVYASGNGSYDCTTVTSSGVSATVNTWGTYSGSCN